METAAVNQMKELVKKLNEAAKAYYQEDREIMSNREYDALYDQLEQMEAETGIVLADSPTVNVGYEAVDALPKETHESPMLSLDKTKERETLRAFIGTNPTLLSWKMDGLTIVLTYENGELQKAVTRGNGIVGEVITNNARTFKNIPLKIAYQGRLVLRGEAIITYSDFERINETIEDVDAKYKNPRNLCSGSVRQLNNQITAERNVRFYAFALVSAQDVDMHNSRAYQMEWLKSQGFEVVEYQLVTAENMQVTVQWFAGIIQDITVLCRCNCIRKFIYDFCITEHAVRNITDDLVLTFLLEGHLAPAIVTDCNSFKLRSQDHRTQLCTTVSRIGPD